MIKAASAAIALMAIAAPAAMADGFYLNPEYNLGFSGNQPGNGGALDAHIGYSAGAWYIQGGPTAVFDEAATDYQFSAKTGLSAPVSERMDLYTEVSMMTGDKSNSYGLKLGGKYRL